ncbi:MAG: PIN domain-containing protein [Deltaproteobacteria bacterium]|nr:PIN domain-containing protein [Deltaproteobacteria bacterium]MBW2070520.1 PIN domain-containing protein [Deltaproteobacteria bacterium]
MLENKTFIDTNIIIYAYDLSADRKREAARDILAGLWNSGFGMISTQVLQEFFVNVVQKIPKPMDAQQAREIVQDFLKWQVVVNTGDSIIEAIEISIKFQYSFWDSMIIAAAIAGGAAVLLSEDLQDGQVINGLTIKNPFIMSQ